MTNEPVILTNDLTRVYALGDAKVVGLRDVTLSIAAGELVVIKGVSGSGKSTLLSLLAGLDQPSDGELRVAGHDLQRAGEADLTRYRRRVVGMVFQSFNLLPTLTVAENVTLPAELAGRGREKVRRRAGELLEWLGLQDRITHFPAQLSGGEMQRTAIARALINDPPLILADEPTGNLDSRNGKRVVDLLAELNQKRRRTVVIATHSRIADAVATCQLYLRDGTLAEASCSE